MSPLEVQYGRSYLYRVGLWDATHRRVWFFGIDCSAQSDFCEKFQEEVMSYLFSPIELRGLKLPNRVVVSPMCQYSAVDGAANSWHLIHLGGLALSGAGLLTIEA